MLFKKVTDKETGRVMFINLDAITMLKSVEYYGEPHTSVHMSNGERLHLRESIEEILGVTV